MLKIMTNMIVNVAKRCGICVVMLFAGATQSIVAETVTGVLTQKNVDDANGQLTINGEVVVNSTISITQALTVTGNGSAKIVSKTDGVTFDLQSGANNISFDGISFVGSQRSSDSDFFKITVANTVPSFVNCTFADCGSEGCYAINVSSGGANINSCKFSGSVGEDVYVGTKKVNVSGNNIVKFRIKTRSDGTPNYVNIVGDLTNEAPMEIYYDLPDGCMGSDKTIVVDGCNDVAKFISGKSDLRVVTKGNSGLAVIPKLDFIPGALYNIKNQVSGTSLLLGEPSQSYMVGLGESGQVGAAKINEGATGYRILSPCGGVFVYKAIDYTPMPFVENDQDYDMEIWPKGNSFAIICVIKDGEDFGQQYIAYDDTSAGYDILPLDNCEDKALWEITQLPDGAIVDVPREVSMPNCVWKEGEMYVASSVSLSDDAGFACFHEVTARSLKFSRVFKTGWQGLSVPFKLDIVDFDDRGIGSVWQIDKAEMQGEGMLALRLKKAESVEPNMPYLIFVTNPGTYTFEKYGCQVYPHSQAESSLAEVGNIACELSCVYDFTEVPVSQDDSYTKTYALSGGEFKRPQSEGIMLKPYRVLLTVTTTGEHPMRVAVKTDDISGLDIDAIEMAPANEQWYDLNGRPAPSGTHGIIISPSGKLFVR